MNGPHSISLLLSRLARRLRRLVWADGLLAIALLLSVWFWITLAIDYLPVRVGGSEMPRSARAVAFGALILAGHWVAWQWLVRRLLHRPADDSLALLIERSHPRLGGRLLTAVQTEGDDQSAAALVASVRGQAESQLHEVDVDRALNRRPVWRKTIFLVPFLLAGLGLFVASPGVLSLALSRLTLGTDQPWPRRVSLSWVAIEVPVTTPRPDETPPPRVIDLQPAGPQTVRLPRGADAVLRIAAADETAGHDIPPLCTATFAADDGSTVTATLRRIGRPESGRQRFVLDAPPLSPVSRSGVLRITGGDDRIDDLRIEAVPPPKVTAMRVGVRYPNYLRVAATGSGGDDQPDASIDYASGLQIREGSAATLRVSTDRPIQRAAAVLLGENGLDEESAAVDLPLSLSPDGQTALVRLPPLTGPASVRIVPIDSDNISSLSPYRYFFGVVRDAPPEIKLDVDGIGTAITPDAALPMTISATDDYGVRSAGWSMIVLPETDEDSADELPPPTVYEQSVTLDRDGRVQWRADLRELARRGVLTLPIGGSIRLSATATDGFDLQPRPDAATPPRTLSIVTPEELVARLQRLELELRGRLQQAIDEAGRLRASVGALRGEFDDATAADATDRATQRLRLRIQQSSLQVAKSTDELAGVVAGMTNILEQLINNRVDSIDRRERIADGVRDPLARVVNDRMPTTRAAIVDLERLATSTPSEFGGGVDAAIQQIDALLRELDAVLQKMLELEDFNEILDIVRGLIDDQEALLKETEAERKKRVMELFE